MTGPAPTGEKLYAALDELRQASESGHARHDGAWRTVAAFLRQEDPRGTDDARQETLINVMRSVRSFEGRSAGEAVRWLRTVHWNRSRDLWRGEKRDLVRKALERTQPDTDPDAPAVEQVPAPEPTHAPHAAEALTRTRDMVFARLDSSLARDDGLSHAKRELRRLQARAAWLRLVQGEDAEAIEAALAPAAAQSRAALYKWIERGRGVLLEVCAEWTAELGGVDEDDEGQRVSATLQEIIGERRADAGVARPERRKG
jgi:DNA-directed RNA polymerase specialized sigma24 family protein